MLIANWRQVLKRAWSIRLIAIAGLLSGAEAILPLFTDNPPVARGAFAAVSLVVTAGAFVSRLLAQKEQA